MTAIRIFFEKKSTHRAEISRQEKHLDLSKAAGQPYLAIRPRSTCCTVVCDWQALHPIDWLKPHPAEKPPEIALFARQAERHIDAHWQTRHLRIRPVAFGTLTQIDRVPAHLPRSLPTNWPTLPKPPCAKPAHGQIRRRLRLIYPLGIPAKTSLCGAPTAKVGIATDAPTATAARIAMNQIHRTAAQATT